MGRKKGKSYSAQFKFQVVMECLKSDSSDAEAARAYDVHPVTVAKWKKQFEQHGPKTTTRGSQAPKPGTTQGRAT